MELTLQELQRYNIEMLREVSRICEKEGIPWWMFYGSMLGAVRHHGYIPWDSDIDIAVPEEYYQRFSEAMARELDSKFWWDHRSDRSYPRCFGRVGLVGYDTYYLHVDVYRLIGYTGKALIDSILSAYGHLLIRMRLVKTVAPKVYKGRKRMMTRSLKALMAPVSVRWLVERFDGLCRRHPCSGAKVVGTLDGRKWLIEKRWLDETLMVPYEDMTVPVPRDYDQILTRWYGDYMTPPEGMDTPDCRQRKVHIEEW